MSSLEALGGFALDAIVRGTLLLMAVAAAAPLLRHAAAATRHALWGAALTTLLVMAAAGPVIPRYAVLPAAGVTSGLLPPATPEVRPTTMPLRPPEFRAGGAPSSAAPGAGNAIPLRIGLGLIWLLGATTVAVAFAGRRIALARVAAAARPVEDPRTRVRLRQLGARIGVSRNVRVLTGCRARVPVTWGTIRPVILLPGRMSEWPESRLDCVLLHELAHVRRCDHFVQTVASLACILHWYNPLVWLAWRRLRAEAEEASDGIVLAAGTPGRQYAGALVAVLEEALAGAGTAGVTMAAGGGIEGRVRRILRVPHRTGRRTSRLGAVIAVAVVGAVAGTAAFAGPTALQDRIVAALVQALEDDVPEVRRSAINSLRDIGDPFGIQAIRPLLEDPDPDVRHAAEVVLGVRPARPNKPIPVRDPPLLGGADVDAAIRTLDDPDPGARQQAAGRLQAARDRRAVAALVGALGDVDEDVRRQAAESLGRIADPAATEAVIRATRDPDPHVRQSAVGALGAIGGDRGAGGGGNRADAAGPSAASSPVLTPAACESPSPVLEDLAGTTVAAEIRALLLEPDDDRRTRAAWSLGHLVTAERPGPSVIVGKHPTPRDAREALTIAMYDPHRPVRLAAACSIERIGEHREGGG